MTAPSPRPSQGTDDFARGLAGIVAGKTAICSLDGDLRYRGYSIAPLAEAGDFEDVAHLLLHGHLPTAAEHTAFTRRVHEAAASIDPTVIEALRVLTSEPGTPLSTGASGAMLSTVHETDAAELVLPAASVALTARLCAPSARSLNDCGEVHAPNAPPSTEQVRLAPSSAAMLIDALRVWV